MNVLRHDHIRDKLEAVLRANLVENLHEAMAGPRCAQQGSATITAKSDEVEIAASVKALQTVAHEKSGPGKVKDRTLERHKSAAPVLTSTAYKG